MIIIPKTSLPLELGSAPCQLDSAPYRYGGGVVSAEIKYEAGRILWKEIATLTTIYHAALGLGARKRDWK